MKFSEKLQSFKKRFNIIDNHNEDENFNQFKIRALNIFDQIDLCISEEGIRDFCTNFAIRISMQSGIRTSINNQKNIITALTKESDEHLFYLMLETIFDLPLGRQYPDNLRIYWYEKLTEAFNISNINVSITQSVSGEILFYPRGEKLLDEGLIEETLTFLDPSSQKHFVSALNSYEKKEHHKSAESIRRTLEEFLKFKLTNQKSLAGNIKDDLLPHLEAKGVAKELRNLIKTNLDYLEKFFNNHTKHNDGAVDEASNEFLIYQAGTLMRYISKVIR